MKTSGSHRRGVVGWSLQREGLSPTLVAALLAAAGCQFDPSGLPYGSEPGPDAAIPLAPDARAPVDDPQPPVPDPFCDATNLSLIACWTFEPGGDPTRFSDGSGYGNHVTVIGAAVTDGVEGAAVVVSNRSLVSVAHSESLGADVALTMEGWIKLDSLPGTRGWMLDKQAQYGISVESTGHVRCAGGGSPVVSEARLEPGVWTHVACVVDKLAGERRVYLDGSPSGVSLSASAINAGSQEELLLGGDSPCAGPPCSETLEAAIDQMRLWRSARGAAEICAAAGQASCGGSGHDDDDDDDDDRRPPWR